MKKILLSIFLVLSIFVLTGCTSKETKTLNSILDKLNSLPSYKQLKEYSTISERVNKNILTISVKTEEKEASYDFILKDDFISVETTKNDNDVYAKVLYLYVTEAIADYNDMDSESIGQYVKAVIEDKLKNDYVKFTETDEKITYYITIKKFDVEPLLKTLKVTEESLELFDKLGDTYTSSVGSRGYFIYCIDGSKEDSAIILAERNGFSNNAYDSLITLIKYFYNEKQANEFVSNYPNLEEKTFGKFKVEFLDQNNEDIIDRFDDLGNASYKFVRVSYNK